MNFKGIYICLLLNFAFSDAEQGLCVVKFTDGKIVKFGLCENKVEEFYQELYTTQRETTTSVFDVTTTDAWLEDMDISGETTIDYTTQTTVNIPNKTSALTSLSTAEAVRTTDVTSEVIKTTTFDEGSGRNLPFTAAHETTAGENKIRIVTTRFQTSVEATTSTDTTTMDHTSVKSEIAATTPIETTDVTSGKIDMFSTSDASDQDVTEGRSSGLRLSQELETTAYDVEGTATAIHTTNDITALRPTSAVGFDSSFQSNDPTTTVLTSTAPHPSNKVIFDITTSTTTTSHGETTAMAHTIQTTAYHSDPTIPPTATTSSESNSGSGEETST